MSSIFDIYKKWYDDKFTFPVGDDLISLSDRYANFKGTFYAMHCNILLWISKIVPSQNEYYLHMSATKASVRLEVCKFWPGWYWLNETEILIFLDADGILSMSCNKTNKIRNRVKIEKVPWDIRSANSAKSQKKIGKGLVSGSKIYARTRQIIRYRATSILRWLQIKQYTASNEGGGVYKTNGNILKFWKYIAAHPTAVFNTIIS